VCVAFVAVAGRRYTYTVCTFTSSTWVCCNAYVYCVPSYHLELISLLFFDLRPLGSLLGRVGWTQVAKSQKKIVAAQWSPVFHPPVAHCRQRRPPSRRAVARVPARRRSQQATAAVLAGASSIRTTTRLLRVWSESPLTHRHDLPPHGPSVMIIAAREPSAGKELQRARLAQHYMYPDD